MNGGPLVLWGINARWSHPAFGLRRLQAQLGPRRPATLREWTLKDPPARILSSLIQDRPRILGIAVYIWNAVAVVRLLQGLPQYCQSHGLDLPLLVWGGPQDLDFATELPKDGLDRDLPRWHVRIRGEGELAFAALVRTVDWLDSQGPSAGPGGTSGDWPPGLDPHSLAGALAMVQDPAGSNGEFAGRALEIRVLKAEQLGQDRPMDQDRLELTLPVGDLADLASPYSLYHGHDIQQGRFLYVESSRGCPWSCEFCQSALEATVRYFPMEAFLADMAGLLAAGGRRFKFLDRSFNCHIPRAREIAGFFAKNLPSDGFVHFELVPEHLPEELLEVLASFRPGQLRLELGVQTLNPLVAGRIKRRLDGRLVELNLGRLARETGATLHVDLIAGLPGEDMASIASGFDRLWALNPGEIQLGLLKLLPGAPIQRHTQAFGMDWDPLPPFAVRSTADLSPAQICNLGHMARFLEILVNREAFPGLRHRLFPPGEGAFATLETLSRRALDRFGQSHALDRGDLAILLRDLEVFGPDNTRPGTPQALWDLVELYRELKTWAKAAKPVHGPWMCCRKGCSDCCTGVDFSPVEREYLARGLGAASQGRWQPAEGADGFTAALLVPMTRALDTMEGGFSGVLALHARTCTPEPPGTDPGLKASYRCRFLGDRGQCAVYPWRPLICRVHGFPLEYPVQEFDAEGQELKTGETSRVWCDLNFRHPQARPLGGPALDMGILGRRLAAINQRYRQR